jgi:transposase InsO family protein
VSRCEICNSQANNREPETVTPIISKRCLDRIYIDLMDFTTQPEEGHEYILQIKDHFSRMIWLYAIQEKSSTAVARCMATWFSLNGSPSAIYCDNGTEFQGDLDDLVENRLPPIPIIRGRAYHPQTQGSIEVHNREFKRHLAALREERGLSWLQLLPELQEVANTTGSRMLPNHVTPFEVWFGRKPHWLFRNTLGDPK